MTSSEVAVPRQPERSQSALAAPARAMIGADASGQLQLLGLRDPLGGEVGWPKGLRDQDFGVRQFALDHAVALGKGDEIMSGMTAFAGVSDATRLTSPPSERSRAACSAGSTDSIEPIETFR